MNWLTKIQKQPFKVRVRILWTVAILVGLSMLTLWTLNLRSEFQQVDNTEFSGLLGSENRTEAKYVKIERVSNAEGLMNIYFSVTNPTSDIMTFSTLETINLSIETTGYNPIKLTDRQNQPFVQKILSNTTEFGVITFTFTDADEGTITFDQIYFENSPQNIIKESLTVDFEELNQEEELRS